MRSDDEEDEDDLFDDNEEEEEDVKDANDQEDENMEEFEEDDGDAEDDEDGEADGDDDDEDDDDGDGDGGDDQDGDDDEDEDEDAEDDDDDGDDDDDAEDEAEADVEMANGAGSAQPTPGGTSTGEAPLPPHLVRRSMFIPGFTTAPKSLTVEAIVAIPLPCAVQSIAATACSSYLLAGAADGYVRAYDVWGSVNGAQAMTAQQRSVVGMGESFNKAGVVRGWWANEVEGIKDGSVSKRLEPVYSIAVESDGLWTLTGTQSGPINLSTLRHSPGHTVHCLKGHSNVVSAMTLLPDEKSFLSGSWDGTVREWDLNTGQTVRTYPTHGAQISSLGLQPTNVRGVEEEEGGISISLGADYGKETAAEDATAAAKPEQAATNGEAKAEETNGDVEMSTAPSPYDPLFDDDEDETAQPPPAINDIAPPAPSAPSSSGPGLALPGASAPNAPATPAAPSSSGPAASSTPLFNLPQPTASSSRTAAANIPVLSRDSWKSFSSEIFLYSSMDGQVVLADRRVPSGSSGGVGRLSPGEKAPPWCMSACWNGNGTQVFAGRRNGTIDIWDVRKTSSSSTSPNLLHTLRTPQESGPVSCVVAFPDGSHIATASQDNLRLWNTSEYFGHAAEDNMRRKGGRPPFKIIAGHHGGTVSSMLVDPTCRFLVTASGDRGWQGESTKVMLIHEIKY